MAKAKKLKCKHLFHLACLRSCWIKDWLRYTLVQHVESHFLLASLKMKQASICGKYQVKNSMHSNKCRLNQSTTGRHTMAAGLYPNQTPDSMEGIPWRGVAGLDSAWLHSWPNQGIDGAGPSTAIRSTGLGRVQLMMRHLASIGENYAQSSFEDTAWSLWPINPSQSGSGSPVPPLLGRFPGGSGSLHMRNASRSTNDNLANILAMAETVREVLPHIPDDINKTCSGQILYQLQ